MPHHSASDLDTIFDVDTGEGSLAVVTPVREGSSYEVNVIINKDVDGIDEENGVSEKLTIIDVISSSLPSPWQRNDKVLIDGETWIVERLMDEDNYVSKYLVS